MAVFLTAFFSDVSHAQTIGDTRVNSVTSEPQKFDGRRWRTDWDAVNFELGDFTGQVDEFADLATTYPNPGLNDRVRVLNTSFIAGGLIEAPAGVWYYNGSAWTVFVNDPDFTQSELNFYDQTGFEFDTVAANPNPANALPGQPAGDRIIEAYTNGTAYFLRLANSWELRAFVPSADVADLGVGAIATCPHDYQNTTNQQTSLDLSATEIVPAGTIIGIGVEAPTATDVNQYVNIGAGYISYERVE